MVVCHLIKDVLTFCYREIDEGALEQTLSAAVTCTILAAAGPQRSRVLATLYKVKASIVKHERYMSIFSL